LLHFSATAAHPDFSAFVAAAAAAGSQDVFSFQFVLPKCMKESWGSVKKAMT